MTFPTRSHIVPARMEFVFAVAAFTPAVRRSSNAKKTVKMNISTDSEKNWNERLKCVQRRIKVDFFRWKWTDLKCSRSIDACHKQWRRLSSVLRRLFFSSHNVLQSITIMNHPNRCRPNDWSVNVKSTSYRNDLWLETSSQASQQEISTVNRSPIVHHQIEKPFNAGRVETNNRKSIRLSSRVHKGTGAREPSKRSKCGTVWM